jgi:tetratricopeptide (TPR) repeat protein
VIAAPCAAQDPAALARAGTAAVESRRFGEALEAFTRAAELRPDDATLYFGAGLAAFMLGQDERAQAQFERALSCNPHHLPAATWLGDLHYRAGRLPEAIAIYEAALRRSPGDRELQHHLDDWRRELELQRRFHEFRTDHFVSLFEHKEDEPLARRVGERLEAAYSRIGKMLGVYPDRSITVVLYTREQFSDITKLATWSAAAYDGRIRVPLSDALEQADELDRVLSHEFVHAVVATLGGRTVPAWLSEGLATALEPPGVQDAVTPSANPVRPALSKLHRGFVDFSSEYAEMAYASAALAVRRLIDRRGVDALVALLKDLSGGAEFDRAFRQRIEMRYEDFETLASRD